MKLVGMLDSPFVRRTAIGLAELGFTFEHLSLSVMSNYREFRTINPLVKAPTLVLDNGSILVDSSLILQYAERISTHSLYSEQIDLFTVQQQIIAMSSIANEKTVQVVYEQDLRTDDKHFAPWLTRVTEQLTEAYRALEQLLVTQPTLFSADKLSHASISAAVSWFFTQNMRSGLIDPAQFPALVQWSAIAEATPAFQQYPYDFGMSEPGTGMKGSLSGNL